MVFYWALGLRFWGPGLRSKGLGPVLGLDMQNSGVATLWVDKRQSTSLCKTLCLKHPICTFSVKGMKRIKVPQKLPSLLGSCMAITTGQLIPSQLQCFWIKEVSGCQAGNSIMIGLEFLLSLLMFHMCSITYE